MEIYLVNARPKVLFHHTGVGIVLKPVNAVILVLALGHQDWVSGRAPLVEEESCFAGTSIDHDQV